MVGFIVLYNRDFMNLLKCLDNVQLFKMPITIVVNSPLTEKGIEYLKKYSNDIINLEAPISIPKAYNMGIKYVKEKYNPEFYILLNQDITIETPDFFPKLSLSYKTYNFDSLGPAFSKNNLSISNPYKPFKNSENIADEMMKCNRMIQNYKNNSTHFFYKISKIFEKKEKDEDKNEQIEKNVALNSNFIVFSKKYIIRDKNVFDERVSYYFENLLSKKFKKENLISIYNPYIKVKVNSPSKNVKERLDILAEIERQKIKDLEVILKDN